MAGETIRLTMAQALVRYLVAQKTLIDGKNEPLFPGVFAIFGHGNVTCLSEALEAVKDELPTWRGQNEQSMALAAIGFAKAKRRRQIMVAATSIGPGALNMVTAAGTALANRLPVLLLAGDTFINRRPDPVLQQVEQFGDPTITVNDAFKAVSALLGPHHPSRADHLVAAAGGRGHARPGRLRAGLHRPAAGRAGDRRRLSGRLLRQKRSTRCRGRGPTGTRLAQAVEMLRSAKRPLLIAGGGVRYSFAEKEVAAFAEKHGIPLVETIAGKSSVSHDHPGPCRARSASSARPRPTNSRREADVVLAIGTRLQDFTTGSWTAFAPDAQFISINTARWDAVKHRALPVVGDARERWRSSKPRSAAGRPTTAGWTRAAAPSPSGTPRSTTCRSPPTIRSRPMRRSSAS